MTLLMYLATAIGFPFPASVANAAPTGYAYAAINYVCCVGSGSAAAGWGKYASSDGMFGQMPGKVAWVTDGLSNTVAFSETLLGPGGGAEPPASAAALVDARRQILTLSGSTVTDAVTCANGLGNSGAYYSNLRSAKWINGHYADANFNHFLMPNDPRPDCSNASHNPGLAAARSNHAGGVNVLLGDGSVRSLVTASPSPPGRHSPRVRAMNRLAIFDRSAIRC